MSDSFSLENVADLKHAWSSMQLPASKEAFLAELPNLLAQTHDLSRETAHLAVHGVVMGLAAGRCELPKGAPLTAVTTDRVLDALDEIDQAIVDLKQDGATVGKAFEESYERFRQFAQRALDHCGPLGLWGPLSIYGPLDRHPMTPGGILHTIESNADNLAQSLKTRPTDAKGTDLLKRSGEHNAELLPGGLMAFVGPFNLYWMLNASGHLAGGQPIEGGAWNDEFGQEITKIKLKHEDGSTTEIPLNELHHEDHAQANPSPDAFFGVEGSAERGDVDTYQFSSKHKQWITLSAQNVTPGKRFKLELMKVEKDGTRTKLDVSEGIRGPSGIHVEVPRGKYEAVIQQIDENPNQPELTEHPVGKRLGPGLMEYREGWEAVYPDKVDKEHEADPDRYRFFVSGTGRVDESNFGPPDEDQIKDALMASEIQESTLTGAVNSMETFLNWVDTVGCWFGWGMVVGAADDRSDPNQSSDPMIERYMRCVKRLGPLFYGGSPMVPSMAELMKNNGKSIRASLDFMQNIYGLPGPAQE